MLLWCLKCRAGYGSVGEIPPECPRCGVPGAWTTTEPLNLTTPLVAWRLTWVDRRFLRSLGIACKTDESRDAHLGATES